VALDAGLEAGEVESHSRTVIKCDGGLDVTEEGTGFLGYPLSDSHECVGELILGGTVEAFQFPCHADGTSACLGYGTVLLTHFIIS